MPSKPTVVMHFPEAHLGANPGDGLLDLIVRAISVKHGKSSNWPDKYGTNYEDDQILIHQDCQGLHGDSGECAWCIGCRCPESNWVKKPGIERAVKIKWTCPYCTGTGIFSRFAYSDGRPFHNEERPFYNPPNFWHKPSDFRLTWYKYIGRDMNANMEPPETLRDLVTVADIKAVLAKGEEAHREFAKMLEQFKP